jgi:N-acetylmuramoyl-L-alanine amidase
MMIAAAPSPNFGPRAAGKKVSLLILHYTGVPSAREALEIMQNPEKQVSAHYLVDETGAVLKLVDEEMRAWHAGKSYWGGETDINSVSVGIEIQNPGHEFGLRPFPPEQMDAVTELCLDIIARHGILPQHVLAHSDIAPERKKDPGELFPWWELAAKGVGLWPETTGQKLSLSGVEIKSLLEEFGYDPRVETGILKTAFQRHFQPEALLLPGESDPEMCARLAALVRQKK